MDISYHKLVTESKRWATEFLSQNYLLLAPKPTSDSDEACALPPTILLKDKFDEKGHAHGERGHTINMKTDMTLEEMVQQVLTSGSSTEKKNLRKISNQGGVTENCLVENWIGSARFAFVDLSAGPFSWGPMAGGQGLKTFPLFPNLEDKVSLSMFRYRKNPGFEAVKSRRLLQEDAAGYMDDYYYSEGDPLYLEDYENYEEEEEGIFSCLFSLFSLFVFFFFFSRLLDHNSSSLPQGEPKTEEQALKDEMDQILQSDIEESLFIILMDEFCTGENAIKKNGDFCLKLVTKYQNLEYLKAKNLSEPKKRLYFILLLLILLLVLIIHLCPNLTSDAVLGKLEWSIRKNKQPKVTWLPF